MQNKQCRRNWRFYHKDLGNKSRDSFTIIWDNY